MVTIKPNWDKAPEWANWWTIDEDDGMCYWYEFEPWRYKDGDYGIDIGRYGICRELIISGESKQEHPIKITEPKLSKSQQLPFIVPRTPDFTRPATPSLTASIETKLDRIIELLEIGQVVYVDSTQRIEDLLKEQEADLDDLLTLVGIRPPEM